MDKHNNKEKYALNSYDTYSVEVKEVLLPIVELLKKGQVELAEGKIASLALSVCASVKNNTMPFKLPDEYFTLLDIYIGDNFPKIKISEEIKDIIIEGMLLHDLGKDYGANLDQIELLAKKILQK